MKKYLPFLLLSSAVLALFAGSSQDSSLPSHATVVPATKPAVKPPAVLERFHTAHIDAFADSPGFGASRTVQPPMWQTRLMTVTLPRAELPPVTYQREQFNLVSLLNHNSAVVYTPTPAPHGERGRNANLTMPTRVPDLFEIISLGKLKAGENLVVEMGTAGELRLLGAVRARATCVECHEDKQEGDLLGAFSYRLAPVPAQLKVESAPPSRQPAPL